MESLTLQKIITNYRPTVQKQCLWASLNQKGFTPLTVKLTRQIGLFFLEILILSCYQGNEEAVLQRKSFDYLQTVVMKAIEKKFGIENLEISHVLGMWIKDKLQNQVEGYADLLEDVNNMVPQLKQRKLEQMLEQQQPMDDTTIIEESVYFPAQIKQEHDQSQAIISPRPVHESSTPQILQHLQRLSNPQGEITYLTQHMGWPLPDYQRAQKQKPNEYACRVQWNWKGKKGNIDVCSEASNKKQGKFINALKALKQIYITNPDIWEQFRKVRESKKLVIPEDGNNQQLLFGIEEEGEKLKKEKIKFSNQGSRTGSAERLKEDILGYLQNITSYKGEMSHLVQQNVKQFELPVHQKSQKNAMWTVLSSIKAQRNGKTKTFHYESQHLNSKLAEENNIKSILFSIYSEFPDVWLKFKNYKKTKNYQF